MTDSQPRPHVVAGDDLDPVAAPDGERWHRVFEAGPATLVRVRLGGDRSEWHSNGERAAYGVVVEGTLSIRWGADEPLVVDRGEFFRVPPGVARRNRAEGRADAVALVALVGAGETVVRADGPTAGGPAPRRAGREDLVETSQLAELTRLTPFPDAPVQQVRGHAAGEMASEWHHHGDNDVFGHVLAGEGYVEWGTDADERALARAGEFFHVPAGVVHRDVNPTDDEQEYVLWLTGSEPRLVRVDGPRSDPDGDG